MNAAKLATSAAGGNKRNNKNNRRGNFFIFFSTKNINSFSFTCIIVIVATVGETVTGIVVAVLDVARLVVALPDFGYTLAYASDRNFNSMYDKVSFQALRVGDRVSGKVTHIDEARTLIALRNTTTSTTSTSSAKSTIDSDIVVGALVNGEVASVGQRFVGVAIGSRRGTN